MCNVKYDVNTVSNDVIVIRAKTPLGKAKTLNGMRLIGKIVNNNNDTESDNFNNYAICISNKYDTDWGGQDGYYRNILFREGFNDYGILDFSTLNENDDIYIAVCNCRDNTSQITKSVDFNFVFFVVDKDYQEKTGIVIAEKANMSTNANYDVGMSDINKMPDSNTYEIPNTINFVDWSIDNETGDILIHADGTPSASGLTGEYATFCNVPYYLISQWVGKKAILHIDIEDENYTGNDSTSWRITSFYASTGTWWNSNPKQLGVMQGGKVQADLDIDDYAEYVTSQGGNVNNARILFGLYYANIPVIDGTASIDLPETTFRVKSYISFKDSHVIATELKGFKPENYYTKQEVDSLIDTSGKYITCWGDSLTAGGGWTNTLQTLSNMPVYNGGTGGENAITVMARQGGDVMMVNNITIPSSKNEAVTIASMNTEGGISTFFGKLAKPLLQGGGTHVNPAKIGDIEGTLRWTGSNYADVNGTWTFTRTEDGDTVTVDRPTAITTNYDRNRNAPHLMVIFMGQNGGYDNNNDTLIQMHKRMIAHAHAKNYLILGFSSGSAASRASYEASMRNEFGRYFLSLREYLSTPIYEDGQIVSCYGMADQNVAVDPEYTYDGKTTIQEISEGICPHQILRDSVHYTDGTKTVIGNLIYKYCCELGIF
jgi:hypothetical protein